MNGVHFRSENLRNVLGLSHGKYKSLVPKKKSQKNGSLDGSRNADPHWSPKNGEGADAPYDIEGLVANAKFRFPTRESRRKTLLVALDAHFPRCLRDVHDGTQSAKTKLDWCITRWRRYQFGFDPLLTRLRLVEKLLAWEKHVLVSNVI